MITDIQIKRDKDGNIESSPLKSYRPNPKEVARTKQVMADFELADSLRDKPYREFDNKTLVERMNEDQKAFNSYQEDIPTDDPDQAWRSSSIRPITRNKVISIAAHVTAAIMYPKIFAQNENDQEDVDAATVMRDLMEWAGEQAKYNKTFVYAVISSLVNPATIVHTEFAEAYRVIKEIQEDGSWEQKIVKDEEFSGFQDKIVPIDQLWIADFYIHDIQRQPFLIWRREIKFETAKQKYGHHENFEYIRPGVQVLFNEEDATFYEREDEDLNEECVEEVIYYNRYEDLKLTYINGVIMCDPDQPITRKDKSYPFAKGGFELVDEGQFFYYKSLCHKIGPEQDVVDTLYRMIMDGTYLDMMPPSAVFGKETIGSSVMKPGAVTNLGQDTRLETLGVQRNMATGVNTLKIIEDSMSESSNTPLQQGQALSGDQTAFEIGRLEQNARTLLGLFGKMIGFLVQEFGELRISDILQHMTVGDVMETTNGVGRVKFNTFIMPEKNVDGKKKTRRIVFDGEMPTEPMSEKQKLDMEFKLLDEAGGPDSSTEIWKVNPDIFRTMKFTTKISPDIETPVSDNVRKALMLEEYDRAIANPNADQKAIYQDLLLGSYEKTRDDVDKYTMEQQPMQDETLEQGGSPMVKKLAGGTELSKLVQ